MFKRLFQIGLVILIGYQILNYFHLKKQIPKWVVETLEKNSCSDYETIGMDLPYSVLFNTETIGTVYLTHKKHSHTSVKVDYIDTTVPLFKGLDGKGVYTLTSQQIKNNFLHCWGGLFQ